MGWIAWKGKQNTYNTSIIKEKMSEIAKCLYKLRILKGIIIFIKLYKD